LIHGHPRVPFDHKSLVPPTGFGLTTREGDVNLIHFVNGKAVSDGFNSAEWLQELRQLRARNPEDLDVQILGILTEQPIADPTADDERTSTPIARTTRNGPGTFKT
jgi:hypothetical protein